MGECCNVTIGIDVRRMSRDVDELSGKSMSRIRPFAISPDLGQGITMTRKRIKSLEIDRDMRYYD